MATRSFELLANMRGTWSKPCGSKTNQFRKVPVEIAEAIFRFLIESDQICFALSCKDIYAIYLRQTNSIFKFAPKFKSATRLYELDLCLRLQTNRLIYCTQCSIPHWVSVWGAIRSCLSFDRHWKPPLCCSSYQIWHRPPFTGEVDVCPCFTMTFSTHQLLTYLCRNPEVAYKTTPGRARVAPDIGCDEQFVDVAHLCIFNDHPLVTVRIRTTVWYDETSKTLQVLNRFKFDISKAGNSHLGPFGRTSSNTCVHKDTKIWLADFFHRCKSDFHINTQDHSWCAWLDWDTSTTFEVILQRDLGHSIWPDARWKSHCHN